MKRLAAFSLLLILFPLLFITVHAEDNSLGTIYDSLPGNVTDSFPYGFEDALKEDNGQSAIKKLDCSFFLTVLAKLTTVAASEGAPVILALIGIVFLSSVTSSLFSKSSSGIREASEMCSNIVVFLCTLGAVKPLWEQVSDCLDTIGFIIKASLPVMTGIGASLGQVSSTYISSTMLTLLLTLLEELSTSVLSPLLSVCIAFISVSVFPKSSGMPDVSGWAGAVKKAFTFFITLFSSVLTIITVFQGVIAKGSDTVLLRSIKFASGSAIPIIGGALSEAAGTYISSLSVIKGSAGALVAFSLILSVLPVFLKLFAVRLGLVFSALVSEIIGARNGGVIKEFSSVIDLMIALLAICSTVFIIAVGVFASFTPNI